MLNKKNQYVTTFFIVMMLCLGFAQPSLSSTTVTLNASGDLAGILDFNFDVLTGGDAGGFDPIVPNTWTVFNVPGEDTVSAFGAIPLPGGSFGTFDSNVTLGVWNFGTLGGSLDEGVDYVVNFTQPGGNNLYEVTAVPIPPTILLLGAGLVGLVGMRRRVKS